MALSCRRRFGDPHRPAILSIEIFLIECTILYSTQVIPFRISFRAGISLFEQIVYASKRAMIAGQLRPGDPYPSVRTLSKELKINPNTAHKVVTHLINEGLLESRPGIGTVVADQPDATRKERAQLLGREVEEFVVEAKHLGIGLDELLSSVSTHWQRLSAGERNIPAEPREGDRTRS